MVRYRLLILNSLLLLTILGSHWGRSVESATIAHPDFLGRLSLPFRDWKAVDSPLADADRNLLQPDAILLRRYHAADGQWAELAVVAGHRKRSIHTPGFCMAGGGWETLWTKRAIISIAGRSIPSIHSLVTRDGHHALLTYFFTDGAYCTENLVQFQAEQVLKRFRSDVPVGALVRIMVPVANDRPDAEQEAEAISNEFGRAVLPATLDSIQQTRLTPR